MKIYINIYKLSFLACLKFQCLPVIINNKTTCECANRRVSCDANLRQNTSDKNNYTRYHCEQQFIFKQGRELSFFKGNNGKINFVIYHYIDLVF
jgi:hypothetical protein